jgi:hypothetical protein
VLVLLVGVAVGVILIQQDTIFRLGASPDITPRDARQTNITSNSLSVSWNTKKKTVGYVSWGDSDALGKTARGGSTEPTYTHHVVLESLAPGDEYQYKIISDGEEFDNSGINWKFKTPELALQPRNAGVISGIIKTASGAPVPDAIVYITGSGLSPLSVQTTADGRWFYALSPALNPSLDGYATITPDTLVDIYVQAGGDGIATAQAKIGNINPASEMVLGNRYDFRTTTGSSEVGAVPGQTGIQESDEPATIDSLDEGETIFTTTPEFFGEGPAGGQINVVIESLDPISDTVDVLPDGTWKWSPPTSLAEGAHSITISWLDSSGILQRLTRSFVVFASPDDPAFEATRSGSISTVAPTATSTPTFTPTPTKSPTPSKSQTPSPSPTATPSPTIKPTITPTATARPTQNPNLPPAGISLPTMIGVISGVMLLVGSLLIAI